MSLVVIYRVKDALAADFNKESCLWNHIEKEAIELVTTSFSKFSFNSPTTHNVSISFDSHLILHQIAIHLQRRTGVIIHHLLLTEMKIKVI